MHAPTCPQGGTNIWEACEGTLGCAQRYTSASLDEGLISKLRLAYAQIFDRKEEWSAADQRENPPNRLGVRAHKAFTTAEQKRGTTNPDQAPVLLRPALQKIFDSMRSRMQSSQNANERIRITRDIALFAIAIRTAQHGYDLRYTLGARVSHTGEAKC